MFAASTIEIPANTITPASVSIPQQQNNVDSSTMDSDITIRQRGRPRKIRISTRKKHVQILIYFVSVNRLFLMMSHKFLLQQQPTNIKFQR